jgi:hypothetical protein
MLKYLIFVKVLLLVLMLGFVLWSMKVIDASSVARVFSALGISSESPAQMTLCRSRVRTLAFPDGRKIEERVDGLSMSWMAYGPEAHEISYLDMEKWLSKHCQINVEPLKPQDEARSAYGDFLSLQFIDGKQIKIEVAGGRASPEALFRIDGELVRSEDLRLAVEELVRIAQFNEVPNVDSSPKAP